MDTFSRCPIQPSGIKVITARSGVSESLKTGKEEESENQQKLSARFKKVKKRTEGGSDNQSKTREELGDLHVLARGA